MVLGWLVGAAWADGGEALQRLAALEGTWVGDGVTMELRPYSGGSVVLETWTTASGAQTLTAFHADGDALVATHYCGMGNQARLRAAPALEGPLAFRFWDATNLPRRGAHLSELTLALPDPEHLGLTEVYVQGKEREVTEYAFTRAR